MTPVRRNASGSRIERSTCDSAAKLIDRIASATSGVHDVRVGDVAADERSRAAISGSSRTGARFASLPA